MTWPETEKVSAGRFRFLLPLKERKERKVDEEGKKDVPHLVPSNIYNRDVCSPRMSRQDEKLEMDALSGFERVDVGLIVFVSHASAEIPAKPTGGVRALKEKRAKGETDH